MPLRLAAPHSSAWRPRNLVIALVVVAALVGAERYVASGHRTEADAVMASAPSMAPIAAVSEPAPASPPPPAIVAADGTTIPPERLHGRWTLLFAPGEPCLDPCARVLETLSAVARDPASGVQDGVAQIVLTRPQGREPAREIVVLDPEGHSAGMISYVTDAGRIVSGLNTLRASFPASTTTASR